MRLYAGGNIACEDYKKGINPMAMLSKNTIVNERLGSVSRKALAIGLGVGVLSGGMVAAPQMAAAQDGGGQLEEVTVMARKRSESLQDIPDSVTAFSAVEIENRGVADLGDLSGSSPNFVLRQSQQPGVVFFSMRGVTSARFQEPAAAIVVDGVQLTSEYQIIQAFYDVEQIEILRGPQGSLYGRNAIGGAVVVTTKQPGNELEGFLKAGYGENDDLRLSGSVSAPLVADKFFVNVVASYQDFDGNIKNTFLGNKADPEEVKYGRVKFKILPAENISLDLKASYEKRDGGVGYFVNIPSGDVNDIVPVSTGTMGYGDRELLDFSGQLNWDFDGMTWTTTVSYAEVDDNFLQDIDYSPLAAIDAVQFIDVQSITAETRLTSSGETSLRWLVGAYYANIDQDVGTYLNFEPCFFFDPGSCPLGPVDPATQIQVPFGVNANNNEVFAFFGQVNYDLTEATELTLGLRYDRDKRTQNDLVTLTTSAKTFDAVQPKLSLSHRFSEEVMVYGTVSRGFRSGAFNGTNFVTRMYDAETLWNYEVGAKVDLFNNRMRVNAAAFYIDYNDRQEYVIQGGTGAQTLFNIPKSRIAGFEIEATALVSDYFTFLGSLGVIDSKVKTTNTTAEAALHAINGLDPSVTFDGNNLPNIPKVTFSLGLEGEYPLSETLDLFGRISMTHRGKMHASLGNIADQMESVNLVDMRLALRMDRIEFAVFGENLFDKEYYTETAIPGFGSINPTPGGFQARGRRLGAEIKMSF